MKKINAIGLECPKPVILTKKEIDRGEKEIQVLVNDEVCKQNIIKCANTLNYRVHIEPKADHMVMTLSKDESVEKDEKIETSTLTVGIGSDKMGQGEETLGRILMKSFIYTLSESTPHPTKIVFYNSGVFLTTEGSPVIEELQALENQGVELISCGTCLDYYEIKDKLIVGEISNMYTILESLRETERNIIIG